LQTGLAQNLAFGGFGIEKPAIKERGSTNLRASGGGSVAVTAILRWAIPQTSSALTKLICPTCRLSEFLSSPPAKNIPLVPSGKSVAPLRASRPHEGRFAIVRKRGQGCDGRVGALDERCRCGRQSRVVLIPRRWDQVLSDELKTTVAIKPGTPGRARDKP